MRLSERIVFNGRELSSACPDAHVIDIVVSGISIEHTAHSRIANAGSIFASKRDGTRTITIQLELPLRAENAQLNYNLLRAWAESSQPAPMYLPNNTNGYIECILSEISELDMAKWYEPITLKFTAYDPYFIGVQRQASVGSTAFTVAGDVPVYFKISCALTSAVTSPSWSIDSAYSIGLTGSIGAGLLVIDTEKGLVTLAGSSIMDKLSLTSRFVQLAPGAHIITGSSGTISWNERWR